MSASSKWEVLVFETSWSDRSLMLALMPNNAYIATLCLLLAKLPNTYQTSTRVACNGYSTAW